MRVSSWRTFMNKKFDLVGNIIAYESGELEDKEVLELFSVLIKTGQAFSLQGSYGRMASNLIDAGLIDRSGKVNWEVYENNL